MSEETTTTETTAEATAETTTTETTVVATQSFIDGEGNFTEGWETAYLTEDQRAHARVTGGRVKSIQGLLDTVINSDKMISGDKILRPSENFGDEDWDAFHTAGGWTNQPVEISEPEGLPEGLWSNDRAKMYSEGFNVLRLNPTQVAGVMELHNTDVAQQLTDKQNNAATSLTKLKTDLLTEKGNAYAQFEYNGNVAIEKGTTGETPEFKERIVKKYGKDPDLVRLLGNLGSSFKESGGIPTTDLKTTPADLQTELTEAMNHPAFTKAAHSEHASIMATVKRLNIEIAKNKEVQIPA